MKPYLFKSLAMMAGFALLIGCGSKSDTKDPQTSAISGIVVDNVAAPTKLYYSDYIANTLKSVAIAGGTPTSMTHASAAFNGPVGLVLSDTSLLVVDSTNHAIRQVNVASPYTTTTWIGTVGTSGSDNTAGTFNLPRNAVMDTAGNLYVTDSGNDAVRMITPGKVVSTIVTGLKNPWGIAIDNATPQNLYVTDIGSNSIKKLTQTGGSWTVSVFAGNTSGTPGLPANANGTAAYFNYPLGIATDNSFLYVVDTGNNAIRRIDLTTKDVTLMAGSSTGEAGSAVNATGALATFSQPYAVTYANGALYVADQSATVIRKVSTTAPYGVSAFALN